VHGDGKSHSGLSIAFGSGSILAQSTKQKLVAKSSTESELIALSDKSGLAIWTRDFLESQGLQVKAALVKQDNQSTIAMIDKGASTSERTRHVTSRYFWVKDRISTGELKVEYQPTQEMIADILTKPLQGERFISLRSKLLNWNC
jgi:KUP system potassium uptake protein